MGPHNQLLWVIKRSQYNLDPSSEYMLEDIMRYTPSQALIMRVFSITASSFSVLAGSIAIYFFLAIDYKRRAYRHQLIILLISFDLLKAIFMLTFPATVVSNPSSYFNVPFCKTTGFFISLAMEGSDFTIIILAIHTVILVSKPNLKFKRGLNYEGGLYRYRYLVYAITFFLPLLLSSLAFIHSKGYVQLTNLCYLPASPIWYRLVLSWIPRYLIIVSIFIMYGYIYHHVKTQYEDLEASTDKFYGIKAKNKTILSKIYKAMGFILFTNVTLSDDSLNDKNLVVEESNNAHSSESMLYSKREGVNILQESIQIRLNEESKHQLKRRRQKIERQMKAIFIYPVAYVFIWIGPLIAHGIDYRHGLTKPPIVWLNIAGSTLQASSCIVDAVIFLWKEKPWNITTRKVDNSLNEEVVYLKWRKIIAYLPLFRLQDPMKIKEQDFSQDSVVTSSLPLRPIKGNCTSQLSYNLREPQTSREYAHESIDYAISFKRKLSYNKQNSRLRGSQNDCNVNVNADLSNESKVCSGKSKETHISDQQSIETQDIQLCKGDSSTETGVNIGNISRDVLEENRDYVNHLIHNTNNSSNICENMGFLEFLQH